MQMIQPQPVDDPAYARLALGAGALVLAGALVTPYVSTVALARRPAGAGA